MIKPTAPIIALAALLATPAIAQDETPQGAPSPGEIVAQAAPSEWKAIAPEDLLVMTLAPPARGPGQASPSDKPRQVVIQLMPPPFSQPWVANIRTLAKAHWWDGLAIVRVQDNYVAQWGDPEGEDEAKARALPEGLRETREGEYATTNVAIADADEPLELEVDLASNGNSQVTVDSLMGMLDDLANSLAAGDHGAISIEATKRDGAKDGWHELDPYAEWVEFHNGWPLAAESGQTEEDGSELWRYWPVHCYGMVGVGRGYSPDAGTGAELYTVIGHAPRHLDRNIALVGRVVEGIENLSSLPRGTGPLGFYETAEERVPIASIRLANELPEGERPKFEYLSTDSETFERYIAARANRRDPFFIVPAGGADICNIPVPVRRVAAE